MIVFQKFRTLFISCPGAGTASLYDLFQCQNPHLDGEFCPPKPLRLEGDGSHWIPKPGKYHNRRIPSQMKDYTVIGATRNPYRRAVSFWAAEKETPFLEYVEKLAKNQVSALRRSCCSYYKGIPVSIFLHTETLTQDVRAIPRIGELVSLESMPHRHRRSPENWREFYTEEAMRNVEVWAGDDFERFGYSRGELP